MFQPAEAEHGRKIIVRWRILAERRLDYLIELYQSGRWKIYHEEAEFLRMVQEARAALKVWQALAPPDPSQDRSIEIAIAQSEDAPPKAAADLANGIPAQGDLRKS